MKRALGRKAVLNIRLFLAMVFSLFLFTLPQAAFALPPDAGTSIESDATVRGHHVAYGFTENVIAKPVLATVKEKPGLELSGNDLKTLNRGANAVYSFKAINSGNTPLSTKFDLTESVDDDFDVQGTLYFDANGDGDLDAEDRPVSSVVGLRILPQQQLSLIYSFNVPLSATNGQRALLKLTANAQDSGLEKPLSLERDIEAGIIVRDESLVLLKKGAYNTAANQISYDLRLRNNGVAAITPYAQIDGETIIVDGIAAQKILVRNPIPLNTVLDEITDSSATTVLYHQYDHPDQTYTTTPPEDLSTVDAIAFAIDQIYDPGRANDLAFTVSVLENVGKATIKNTAITYFESEGSQITASSNEVAIAVDAPIGALMFATNSFTRERVYLAYEEPYGLELRSGACNLSSDIDTVRIQLTTLLSNDSEMITATETGPNTGRFHSTALAMRDILSATSGNSIIEPSRGDTVTARASCKNQGITASVITAPGGYVFNSVTDAPLENVVIDLFAENGSPDPVASVTTDETGYFSFGIQPAGDYLIKAISNAGFSFPAQTLALSPATRRVDPSASYGGVFSHVGGPLVTADVPMDEWTGFSLVLEKSANKEEAARGDYVVYKIDARSQTNISAYDAVIEDTLPKGFLYLPGSAKRDGVPMADPEDAPGPLIRFDLGQFNGMAETSIEYVVRIGPTAGQGPRTNLAVFRGKQTVTGRDLTSPIARKTIRVDDSGGVFADEAAVIGKVFLDINGDGLQTLEDETGIPGVKIITSTGISAVTDAFGRYSLFGLRPTTQVFALLRSTLPEGAKAAPGDIDDVLKPGSRLVTLRRGELKTEDFPVHIPPKLRELLANRQDRFDALNKEQSLLRDDLPLTFSEANTRKQSSTEAGLDTATDLKQSKEKPKQKDAEQSPRRTPETDAEREARLKALAENVSPDIDFVDLPDQFVSERGSLDLIAKGPAGLKMTVTVNDDPVDAKRLSGSAVNEDKGVQLFEYIALPLNAGENTIAAYFKDPFGNIRGRAERVIYAPGAPAQFEFITPDKAPADSSTPIPVVVRILDAEGRLVRAPAEVTLSAKRGNWDVRDIRAGEPGLQAYIDNGEAVFDYQPPDLVGSDELTILSSFGSGTGTIRVTPDLNERILVGIIEGAFAIRGGDESLIGIIEDDEINAFEKTAQGVRGQLYLKGKILGDTLLTLRYDSDQDTEERLFRDIARDEYYPVYGDESERGFSAQSSTPLFVKIERGQSYILYGDIAIEPQSTEIKLGAYRRSVNGIKTHAEFETVKVTVFGALTDQNQRVFEFPAEGVSGPYDVPLDGYIDGSEVVTLITRDRDQPDVIINEDVQTRLTDYSLDFFTGALIFNRPISRLDRDLNPVTIRITFETETGMGERYWIYGGEVEYEPTKGITIGARHVTSEGTDTAADRQLITSVYAKADLGKNGWLGTVTFEAARSDNRDEEKDTAFRTSYALRTEKSGVTIELARTGENFDPEGSSVAAAREELRVKADHHFDSKTEGVIDGLYSRDTTSGDHQEGLELRINRTLSDTLALTGGLRAVHTDEDGDNTDVLSGIIGIRWKPRFVQDAALYAEFEQDFVETENWRLGLGSEYQATPKLRMFAEGELTTTDGGNFDIGTGSETTFTNKVGVDYEINDKMDVYSEYRSDAVIADATVASGIKASWAPTEVIVFNTVIEHIEPMKAAERSTSIAVGLDYKNEEKGLLAQTDVEWNGSEKGNGHFSNVGVGYKHDDSLTLLMRNRFAYDTKSETAQLRNRLRLGAALRPKDHNRLRLLGWYEYEIEKQERTEQAHRWALAGTYTFDDALTGNARYAGEYKEFNSDTVRDSNMLHLLQVGAEHEIIENKLSVGAHVVTFTDQTLSNYSFGIGGEVKYNIAEQLQVSLGYNHVTLEEEKIRSLHQSGLQFRIKLKLDEGTWDVVDQLHTFGQSYFNVE